MVSGDERANAPQPPLTDPGDRPCPAGADSPGHRDRGDRPTTGRPVSDGAPGVRKSRVRTPRPSRGRGGCFSEHGSQARPSAGKSDENARTYRLAGCGWRIMISRVKKSTFGQAWSRWRSAGRSLKRACLENPRGSWPAPFPGLAGRWKVRSAMIEIPTQLQPGICTP